MDEPIAYYEALGVVMTRRNILLEWAFLSRKAKKELTELLETETKLPKPYMFLSYRRVNAAMYKCCQCTACAGWQKAVKAAKEHRLKMKRRSKCGHLHD
jgi:hypothetical protein